MSRKFVTPEEKDARREAVLAMDFRQSDVGHYDMPPPANHHDCVSQLEFMAAKFAYYEHSVIGQTRKYTGEPYINHPAAVVELVRSVPHTDEMLAAAWLHDTVNDTDATLKEIEEIFGAMVASLVEMLTDVSKPADGNRKTRKAIDREHTAKASAEAKTIKLADLIDNSHSIIERDPEFAKVYLKEKAALLEVLTEGDPTLYARASEIVQSGTTIEMT